MLKNLSLFVLLLSTFACAQTPLETAVAIRTKAMLTKSPIPVFVYWAGEGGYEHLEWLAKPETMLKLKEYHADKILVLFKRFFKDSAVDRAGVGASGGHYIWKDPIVMRQWIRYFRDVLGFDVYIYVAPWSWRQDGLSSRQFIDEVLRLRRWSGGDLNLYCDGYAFGDTAFETEATLRALKETYGFKMFIHGSVAPNLGSTRAGQEAEFRMPGAEFATVFLHGETNLPKSDLFNWFRGTSYIRHPHINTIHKAAKPKKDEDGKIIRPSPTHNNPVLRAVLSLRYLMVWRISKSTIASCETNFWPQYKAAGERYEDDSAKFNGEMVRRFE